MDDNARGMASKILCDLLNISKGDSASANCENGNIAYIPSLHCVLSFRFLLRFVKAEFSSLRLENNRLPMKLVIRRLTQCSCLKLQDKNF